MYACIQKASFLHFRVDKGVLKTTKGPSMYYVIKIWGFLTPPLFVITFSTERNQEIPFTPTLLLVIT